MDQKRKNIWILEDDIGCQFVYDQILKNQFDTTYFENIQKFREWLENPRKENPIMVIADLMLNDGNFISFLNQEVKSNLGTEIPFIIVSGDDDVESLRLCFKQGANDYLTKPFKRNELLVKIETILKGRKSITRSIKEQVVIKGVIIENLTAKEIRIVELFRSNSAWIISRNELLDKVWGNTSVHPKTIDVHLYNLRRKLSPYGYMIKSEGSGSWKLLQDRIDLSK